MSECVCARLCVRTHARMLGGGGYGEGRLGELEMPAEAEYSLS